MWYSLQHQNQKEIHLHQEGPQNQQLHYCLTIIHLKIFKFYVIGWLRSTGFEQSMILNIKLCMPEVPKGGWNGWSVHIFWSCLDEILGLCHAGIVLVMRVICLKMLSLNIQTVFWCPFPLKGYGEWNCWMMSEIPEQTQIRLSGTYKRNRNCCQDHGVSC